jgi:hemolysin III
MLLQIITDGGPIYAETDPSRFIVEPWNGASAAIFVLIAAFWAWKLKGRYKDYPFLSLSVITLFIGGIGGTIYHAFRLHHFFLQMDWMPIFILCFAASFYFFIKASNSWGKAIAFGGIIFLLQIATFQYISPRIAVNVSYLLLGLLVLIPTFWTLAKFRFWGWKFIAFALISFGLAVFFRYADKWELLPMGTHFLWHTFGAIACHLMFSYVYLLGMLGNRIEWRAHLSFGKPSNRLATS